MNPLKLIAAFIGRKPLTWSFHVLTLALGVGVVTSLLLLDRALEDRFTKDLGGVDLVVGAKGSPLQLILSSLFEIDVPTGNIKLSTAQMLAANHMVKASAPVSLGDNVRTVRIVGTTPAYADLYDARLESGRWWDQPMQVVLGAQAARQLGMTVGSTFVGQHGLSPGGEFHSQFPYRVVGVLKPTGAVIDRLALTDTASVWRVHEHEAAEEAQEQGVAKPGAGAGDREVTALLIRFRSPMGALMMPRLVRATPDLQAAVPAIEVARLTQLLGAGSQVLRGFGIGLLALSALGFFVALFAAVNQRQRELALLRTLGARPRLLLGLVAGEGLFLGLLGGVLGIALGRAAAVFAAHVTSGSGGPPLTPPPIGALELYALAAALAVALIASLLPGLVAYRLDPAQSLKAG
ncbi:MAG: ABC-type transport system permease component [Caulobacter sp.]|nr:ABC-type transport system permease component [Caulobacter sp.]